MTCHSCNSRCKKFGRHRNGLQRFRCKQCRKTFTEDHATPLGSMYARLDDAAKVIELLNEGCSISSAERLSEIHHSTILRLLVLVGDKCERLLATRIHNLPVSDVECDEIWGFVGKKQRKVQEGNDPTLGDSYCFIGLERTTKLILAWHLGKRSPGDTWVFIRKLEAATTGEFQVTTDGWAAYPEPIVAYMGEGISYSQLVKIYGPTPEQEHRYSPPQVIDTIVRDVCGNPDPARICTSHIERANLSVRMGMRRMTRLTNAFSKKWANLKAAYALWFAFYNFCRVHSTLRCTPAMAAGITDHIWSVGELVEAIV
jgi:transposase-like protein/IS1 family transposase